MFADVRHFFFFLQKQKLTLEWWKVQPFFSNDWKISFIFKHHVKRKFNLLLLRAWGILFERIAWRFKSFFFFFFCKCLPSLFLLGFKTSFCLTNQYDTYFIIWSGSIKKIHKSKSVNRSFLRSVQNFAKGKYILPNVTHVGTWYFRYFYLLYSVFMFHKIYNVLWQ